MPAVFDPQTTTWYDSPATEWLEALPIGNGRLWRDGLRRPSRRPSPVQRRHAVGGRSRRPDEPGRTRASRRCAATIFDGEVERAQALAEEKLLGDPVRLRPYQPFGDLALDVGHDDVTEYRRKLDLSAGLVRVRYDHERTTYTREYFASAPDDAIVIRLTADGPDEVDVTVGLHRERAVRERSPGTTRSPSGARSPTCRPTKRGAGSWGCASKRRPAWTRLLERSNRWRGANAPGASDAGLAVTGADDVTIALTGFTSHETADPTGACEDVLDTIAGRPYDDLGAHVADHRSLFDCVALYLGDPVDRPTDERLALGCRGAADPHLAALYAQFGRYLLLASSRPGSEPANLQGVWNDEFDPRGTAGTR